MRGKKTHQGKTMCKQRLHHRKATAAITAETNKTMEDRNQESNHYVLHLHNEAQEEIEEVQHGIGEANSEADQERHQHNLNRKTPR